MVKKTSPKSLDLIDKIRSKEDLRVTCTLSLDREHYEKLKVVAKRKEVKISHIIDELIKEFLAGMNKS